MAERINALEQQARKATTQSTWQARCASCGGISGNPLARQLGHLFKRRVRRNAQVTILFLGLFAIGWCGIGICGALGMSTMPSAIAAIMQKPRYAKATWRFARVMLSRER